MGMGRCINVNAESFSFLLSPVSTKLRKRDIWITLCLCVHNTITRITQLKPSLRWGTPRAMCTHFSLPRKWLMVVQLGIWTFGCIVWIKPLCWPCVLHSVGHNHRILIVLSALGVTKLMKKDRLLSLKWNMAPRKFLDKSIRTVSCKKRS